MSVLRALVLLAIVGTTQAFGLQELFGPPRSRARAYAYAVNAVNARPLVASNSVLGKDERDLGEEYDKTDTSFGVDANDMLAPPTY